MVLVNIKNGVDTNSSKGEFDTASGAAPDVYKFVQQQQDLSGGRSPEEIDRWHQQQRDHGGCSL